jgi:hypothetical protein
MFSESFLFSDIPAPPPRWVVIASLALGAVFTAVFVMTLPPEPRDKKIADAPASAAPSVNSSRVAFPTLNQRSNP